MSLGTPADAIVRDQIIIGQYSVGGTITPDTDWLTPPGSTYRLAVVGDSFTMPDDWQIQCLFDGWVRFEAWIAFDESGVESLSMIGLDFSINAADPSSSSTRVEVTPKALEYLTNIRVARDIEVSANDVVDVRLKANSGSPDITVHAGTFRAKRIRA